MKKCPKCGVANDDSRDKCVVCETDISNIPRGSYIKEKYEVKHEFTSTKKDNSLYEKYSDKLNNQKITNESNWFYNSKSSNWIRIFEIFARISFWGTSILGLVLGILDDTGVINVIGLNGIGWLIWGVSGLISAFVTYTINMLIINFLNNIQLIRINIEKE